MGAEILKPTVEQKTAEIWRKVEEKIPDDLSDEQQSWIKKYLKAQIAFSLKDPTEAYKIFTRLDKVDAYVQFEDKNQPLFAAIDIAVRGGTNRKGVKPLFEINHS